MRSTMCVLRLIVPFSAILFILVDLARADPPGFKTIRVTNTPSDSERVPRINNHGTIVFSRRIDQREDLEEIILYADGTEKRVTRDSIQDRNADINDDGVVVCGEAIDQLPEILTREPPVEGLRALAPVTLERVERAPRSRGLRSRWARAPCAARSRGRSRSG